MVAGVFGGVGWLTMDRMRKDRNMRDSNTPGTDAEQFTKEGAARTSIIQMQRYVEQLNDAIKACRKDGFVVKVGVTPEDIVQVAVEIRPDEEPIRG